MAAITIRRARSIGRLKHYPSPTGNHRQYRLPRITRLGNEIPTATGLTWSRPRKISKIVIFFTPKPEGIRHAGCSAHRALEGLARSCEPDEADQAVHQGNHALRRAAELRARRARIRSHGRPAGHRNRGTARVGTPRVARRLRGAARARAAALQSG